ncbi:efflux RND transporter periplasmic adaptor subunit [Albimonas sp. CAU 1670]|uniref:efflux RND transporter periplasmic adaptor subunit n=1 Tax=Albimonas sp. CAU 1670 TaxID=3032599 RepID=UPI0023D9BDCD|nr:efflux RND transporter periplasmic adaptor subunit [Albimonas sp. CAU 1670]MDF2234877.1 efflux RND transporter periplasmic adaptor subunit [Albimonas sp. CAU 1670]
MIELSRRGAAAPAAPRRLRRGGAPRTLAALLSTALLLGAPGGALAQGAGGQAPPPQAVSIVTATPEAIPVVNELPGRIAATRIAEVRPRVSGIIEERVFTQGALVEADDVLYRIDSAPFKVQVDRAKAAVAQAEAARKRAEQAAARQEELRDRRVVSAQQFDDAAAELAQSTAAVAQAEAELRAAELNLHYSEVRAPISGRIGRARITEGALVSAQGDNLATIQQLDPVYADFTQSATELLALRKAFKAGALTRSASGDVAVRLMFDDGAPYAEEGRLLFSESTVDETTGQVTLRAEFPNPDDDLLPGMYVRVQIEQGVEPDALAVPVQAIQRGSDGQAILYIVGEGDKIEARPVVTNRIVDDRWVIESGLNPGDRVVVEGFQKIRPGAPVTPQPWAKAKAPEAAAAAADGAAPADGAKPADAPAEAPADAPAGSPSDKAAAPADKG